MTDSPTLSRAFSYRRLGRSVYLLPSNDLSLLGIAFAYDETGDAEDHDGQPIVGRRWRAIRVPERFVRRDAYGLVESWDAAALVAWVNDLGHSFSEGVLDDVLPTRAAAFRAISRQVPP